MELRAGCPSRYAGMGGPKLATYSTGTPIRTATIQGQVRRRLWVSSMLEFRRIFSAEQGNGSCEQHDGIYEDNDS